MRIYMVKKNGKYFRRGQWHPSRRWVDDPQMASVWTTHQGPSAAIAQDGGERITLEVDIEKAQVSKP